VFAMLLFAPAVLADDEVPSPRATYSTGERVCADFSLAAVTGKSPWLAMGVGGAVEYANTPDEKKGQVGFFALPWVWGTMLVLVALVAFKDTILTVFSQLKLPLDALAEAFHAAGALFALVYLAAAAFEPQPDASPQTAIDHVRGFVFWLMLAAVHLAVWVVFNTVEVAILLNPIPFVDTVLKTGRTLLMGAISGAAAIHPVFGFVLAFPVILGCLLLVPFALRFAVAGWVFTTDVFKRMFGVKPRPGAPVRVFASLGFPGVPVGVYGIAERGKAGPEFVYRRWFILWRVRVALPWERVAVVAGVLPRVVETATGATWLRFPPRYRGMEEDLALALGLGDVVRKPFRESVAKWWRRVRDRFTRKPAQPAERPS
jgi:hypothetical protein